MSTRTDVFQSTTVTCDSERYAGWDGSHQLVQIPSVRVHNPRTRVMILRSVSDSRKTRSYAAQLLQLGLERRIRTTASDWSDREVCCRSRAGATLRRPRGRLSPGAASRPLAQLVGSENRSGGVNPHPSPPRMHAALAGCTGVRPRNKRSLGRLGEHQFEWILPGHGHSVHLSAAEMSARLRALVERM